MADMEQDLQNVTAASESVAENGGVGAAEGGQQETAQSAIDVGTPLEQPQWKASVQNPSGLKTPDRQEHQPTFGQQVKSEARELFGGGQMKQDAQNLKQAFSKDGFKADWKALSDSFRSAWKRKHPEEGAAASTGAVPQTEPTER